ncbi:MAG: hypothetical protein IJ001_06810 [Oscillospiraceae bacterium]|nr:hypothetical protein [Oscillospiraceae bacterium]
MGYQITYSSEPRKGDRPGARRRELTWLVLVCFLVFVWTFWPEGREVLLTVLLPGDREATLEAAEVFLDSVQCGLSFGDAAEIFCRQVIAGAG